MTIEFSNEELKTLRRLLKHELHEELQFESNKELMSSVAWKEQHETLVSFKMSLLRKLGSNVSRKDLELYDLQ